MKLSTATTQIPSIETVESLLQIGANRGITVSRDAMVRNFYTEKSAIECSASIFGIDAETATGMDTSTYMYNQIADQIPVKYLKSTGSGALSKSKTDWAPLLELPDDEVKPELKKKIQAILSYKAAFKRASMMMQFIAAGSPMGYSTDGQVLLAYRPNVERALTGRFVYTNPCITQIPREYNIVKAPKGYSDVHADSRQIEPNVVMMTILRDPVLLEIYRQVGDVYLTHAIYTARPPIIKKNEDGTLTVPEVPDSIRAKRQLFKANVNGGVYGQRNATSPEGQAIADYIRDHPGRQRFLNEYHERMRKDPAERYIARTLFGTVLDTSESVKLKGENDYYMDTECDKLQCSYTVQGTAADLMKYAIAHAANELYRLSPDSYISFQVYDALHLHVKTEDLKKVRPLLEDLVTYDIDDKIHIGQECTIDGIPLEEYYGNIL